MRQFLSKLIAGGLSAGVILLWWPHFFPGDSVTSWLIRGVAWTLCSELLVLALAPFETALWETRPGKAAQTRVDSARDRLSPESTRQRLGLRGALACAALMIPLVLLATGLDGRPLPGAKPAATKVQNVTNVTRVVKVVRREARPQGSAPIVAPGAGSGASAPVARRSPQTTTKDKTPEKKLSERTTDRDTTDTNTREPAATEKPTSTETAPQPTAPQPQTAPEQQADAGSSAAPGA